jgi:surfactin family lipopeptide synthetase A
MNEINTVARENIQVFPASFAQQCLWFLDQLEPDSAVYNVPITIHLKGLLDVRALERSLDTIVQRHEALRTTFTMMDEPVQVIIPTLTIPLPTVDLRDFPETERESKALQLASEEAQCSFDLSQGPLLRALLLRLGAKEAVLLLTVHHVVFDGWSLGVLLRELATLYEAFSTGQLSPLPELPIQYADFAVWQREMLQGERLAECLAYWKQQLAGMPEGLDLPTDRPHLPVPTLRGSTYRLTLPKWLGDALKELSRREGVSLYMTLVAAFQTLLYRYTGQDDLVIGTVPAGRTPAETEGLIGFFVNTLALRTDLSGNPTFGELLGRVREALLEAQAHQDLPFESLVKELHPTRLLGQNPLFQVMVSFESPLPTLPSAWTLAQLEVETGTTKFDLSLNLVDRPEGLISCFEYNTDLYDEATIARMAGHWQTLLEGITADPERQIATLPLLTRAERHQLLVEWNAKGVEYQQDQCIHQLFESQAERTPEAVAVVFENEQLTYRELNRRANQLAHYLCDLGVGPEVLVGICVERSLDMVVGLLGILKAGGAYVPLDPAFPSERLAFMLEDAQAPVLVTQHHLLTTLPAHGAKVICLDADAAVLAQQSEADPSSGATSDHLAYVIYTSGSTGRPKGVQIVHRAVVNFLQSMREQPGLMAEDTLLAITTLSFDIAALELFLPLMVGARLIVASRDTAADGAVLVETLTRSRVTVMQATPITWRLLLAAGWQGKPDLKILCGGEALPLELAEQLLPRAASLWNLYGPTETTIWSTICKIEPGEEVMTIGRPIANTQIYLLDPQLQPVPVGVPGELYIGGDGLARGYLHRPELTAQRFLPHPFSDEPGARLYKTGDLARYRPDGTIEHLGRLDFQVKLRGFRIELGEIEAVLAQHPAVRQAVVVAREDVPGDKRLVAYVVLCEKQTGAVGDLQRHMIKQLPNYMVPSAVVLLEAFPLTPNGKVDRRALPAPKLAKLREEETFVAPRLLIHQQLVQIWEELLDVRPIGIKDNFFYLGGHSLLAARLVDRIEHVFGKRIALSTLFSGPTIEQLAEALQQQENSDARTSVIPVQVGGSKRPFFYLHGDWTGGAFYCFALGRALGPDQPFYVLEPYKFGGLQGLPSFEAVASAHIESMRAIQPQGPYLLGGFCNGGLLAYEMAQQLQAAGERVDLLALVTPSSTVELRAMLTVSNSLGKLLRFEANKQANLFLRVRHALRHVYRHLRPTSSRVQDFEKLLAIDPRLEGMFPPIEALYNDYIGVFTWLASRYEPGIYPGKITFYWASEEPFIEKTWRPVTEAQDSQGIENHFVPGTHMSCVTEHIQVLAERLNTCVRQVQEKALSQKG